MERREGNDVVTIRDVAQRAGVAISTASRALGGGSASEATRRKVQKAADELHFVPNPAARRLTGGHSNVVALVVDEPTDFLFRDDFLAGILGQLSMSLSKENLLPFLILAEPGNAKGFEQLLSRSGAEGMVVASFHEDRKFMEMLKRCDLPTIFIGKPPKGVTCPYVDVDNYGGGYRAGQLLAELGRKNIAVIEGPRDMPSPKERTAGLRAALKEHGLEPIASCSGSYEMDNGLKSMEKIIAEYPQVDAVFAHSDKIAAGVLHVLDRYGKVVPQDVAVIGFDDLQAARLLNPQLTTLAQPLNDMADAATRMLAYRLEHGDWKVASQQFPVRLVRRESA